MIKRLKIDHFCLFLLLGMGVLVSTAIDGQKVYSFSKALAGRINIHYGREAIYRDPLALALYEGTLFAPKPFSLILAGDSSHWTPVKADSTGRFFAWNPDDEIGFGPDGYLYLSYDSPKEQRALLDVEGSASLFFNGVLHAGDPYGYGWLRLPVKLKKGKNELLIRGLTFVKATLQFPAHPVFISRQDSTMPSIVLEHDRNLRGAVVIVNNTDKAMKGLRLVSEIEGKSVTTLLPELLPMSFRKLPFSFDASAITLKGNYVCNLTLKENGKTIDHNELQIDAVSDTDYYRSTFISKIDGSLQYFAVAPQLQARRGGALFFSVHGAGVEAIGQARAYLKKDWGNLVAPTNRRPRGFNWEDWGRLDALEVLSIAKTEFLPDPNRIYLTGHSMGGHGTWFLGATYPDKWAAIAPCSGYPTLKGYGSADGLIPDSSRSPMERLLLRSGNQSDVLSLATNYKKLGVYILHGDADPVVSVGYARQMRALLGGFQPDMAYYEYPGGVHWFGNQCVDWPAIFYYFSRHMINQEMDTVDFKTSNPGISATYRWCSIYQQLKPLDFSRILLNRDRKHNTIDGTSLNIKVLSIALKDFNQELPLRITLDGAPALIFDHVALTDTLYLLKDKNLWQFVSKPALRQKGPHRYGTFKDAFRNRMVFVYGTAGSKEETEQNLNKAKYDAENWYYRGNGSVDIIADRAFISERYADRNIILYGNASNNKAWASLLKDCPIQVSNGHLKMGDQSWNSDHLGAYFIWPSPLSDYNAIGVVAGSGILGMKAAGAGQYFAGGSGFPDFMIFDTDMLSKGANAVKAAGYYDNDWKLNKKDLLIQ